jgi:hypothetical protein
MRNLHIALIVIELVLHGIIVFYVAKMRQQLNTVPSVPRTDIISTFKIIEKTCYLLLLVTYIIFSSSWFMTPEQRIGCPLCPLKMVNMALVVILTVFVIQTRTIILQHLPSVSVLSEASSESVDMKFRLIEYLSYGLVVFNLASLLSIYSGKLYLKK